MKHFLLLLTCISSLYIFAGNPNRELANQQLVSSRIEMSETEVIKLLVDNPLQKELCVKVYSKTGVLIMKRSLGNTNSYNGRYELQELGAGNYTFGLYLDGVLIDEKAVQL
jgi:hypothetical protein